MNFYESSEMLSKKALLFQDILRFGSTLEENKSFRLWDLAKFLLTANEEIRNRYSRNRLTKANQIENVQRRIKRSIDSLVKLRIMKESEPVKEERGTSLIPTFRFTRFGYVFSQIMQCMFLEDEKAKEELYKIFRDQLFKVEEDSISLVIFASKMIKKMYEKDLFGIYVSTFRKALNSDMKDIESFVKLIQDIISFKFLRRSFFNVWEETINELDENNRKLFMYDHKLNFETAMGTTARNKSYERLRLELMKETETIALEGFLYCMQQAYCISNESHKLHTTYSKCTHNTSLHYMSQMQLSSTNLTSTISFGVIMSTFLAP